MTAARITISLAVLTALLAIGGMWWWALFGMTPEVGDALIVTVFATGMGAVAAGLAWLEATEP